MPSLPMVGDDWAGYRLGGVVGRGGMSVVYEAENPRLGSTVALKVLAPELAADDVFRSRFLKESRTAASLNHPNVIPIYDVGSCGDLLYIAMRYVAGSDLRALLKARHRIPPAEALALLGQAARALDAAHRHGLVHRDVKPGNILVEHGSDEDDPDHVYLTDFGISKHVTSRSGLTATGEFMGTIDYLSPEQIQGKPVDGRTDVYALGCVLYECLTGRVPFVKDIDAAVIWAHVEEPPTPPSAVRPELPGRLDDVVGRALAKRPDDRYLTCREFIGAARAVLPDEPAEPHTVTISGNGGGPDAGSARQPAQGRAPGSPGPATAGRLSGDPAPRRRWHGGRRLITAVGVLALIVAGGLTWMSMRGSTSTSSPGSPPASSPGSTSMASPHTSSAAAKNHLMQALTVADEATHGSLPPSTCAAQSASLVTCSHPHFAVDTVIFRTYPSQDALYTAYVAAVRAFGNRMGDSIRVNFGDCSRGLSYGEVGWNHDTAHPKTYSLHQSRSGRLNDSTEAAGRAFCVITGTQFHLIWTQDAGHLLGTLSGAPHKDAYEWWRPIHHNIVLSGSPMHM
jgi:serine/threonine protein kinase